jgi:hypothetical protein
MMGQQLRTDPLFYYFRLEDQIPDDAFQCDEGNQKSSSIWREGENRRTQRSETARWSIALSDLLPMNGHLQKFLFKSFL